MFSRDHLAVRPERAGRLPAVAQRAEPEHLHLVEVLDRIEAAVHVAVERGVADRHFRLVAGRHHHRARLVGDRHQDHAAGAALDVLLGDVARLAGEHSRERMLDALDRLGDRHDVVANAERLGAGGGVGEQFVRGEAVGQHHRMDALGAERVDRHRRAERQVDAAREAEHHAGEAVLVDIVAQAQDAGRIVGLVALLDHLPRSLDAAPALVAPLPHGARDHRPEGGKLDGEAAVGVQRERRAFEHDLVLPADHVEIDQRQAALDHPRRRRRSGG